ncbi:MAG: hypothetical protein AB7E85_01640 [Pseudobdellovibrionaceae bacterium]
MFEKKKIITPPSPSQMYQTLALYIILLSFFVVLNSISTYEEQKTSPVMESIDSSFAGKAFREEKAPSMTPDPVEGAGQGQSPALELNKLFRAAYPEITDAHVDIARGLFYAELSVEELKSGFYSENSIPFWSFMRSLTTNKKPATSGARVDLIMLQDRDIGEDTQEADDNARLLTARGATLAETMQDMGIPPQHLSIGIEQGQKDHVLLLVRTIAQSSPLEGDLPK